MSLFLSLPIDYEYIPPSFGDIDISPALTREPSAIENPQVQALSSEAVELALIRAVSRHSSVRQQPEETPVIPVKPETTQDKILHVEDGQFVLNSLRRVKSQTPMLQYVSEPELRQSIQVNYQKHHDGTLEMINQQQLKKQKQVLGFLAKQFGSALFTGKSIMNISLPVTIFEPQSHLEREARSLSYAPHFLEKGGETKNTLEQFKFAVTQFVSSLHLGTNPQKPFNPILGETFQGKIGECPVYVEQISHHPPKSAIQLLGKNFKMEGLTEFTADISMNSVRSWRIGNMKIIFKNTNTVIKAQYPAGLMNGTAFGKRTFQFTDKFYIFDTENKYYAEVGFGHHDSSLFKKKSKSAKDEFSGAIWKITDAFAFKLMQAISQHRDVSDLKFKEKEHAAARIDNIEGSWLESLKIGDQIYWTFGALLPFKLQYALNPLPSDSNYRLDVLYMRAEDEVQSQRYKEIIEESQRNDKKLRERRIRKK